MESPPGTPYNTLNGHEHLLEVCSEETLNEILQRYKNINAHAESYTWKRHSGYDSGHQKKISNAQDEADYTGGAAVDPLTLDMTKTLEENGIHDEADEFQSLGLPSDFYIPGILLYYNDDLTVG